MKIKIKSKYISILLIFIILQGCMGFGNSVYYKSYNNGILSKPVNPNTFPKNDNTKESCTYFLSFFLPLNFWNFRFSNKGQIKKVIKELNKEGKEGKNMKDIYFNFQGIISPIFSYTCRSITGDLVK